MKITHICLCAPVTDHWNYQDNILPKYHRKNGHDVSIITSKWIWGNDGKLTCDERDDYYNENDIRVIRLKMKGKEDFNKKLKRFHQLYNAIANTNPEIVFIHGVSFVDIKVIVKYLKDNPSVIAYADNHADWSNSATNWMSANILHGIIWKHYARMLIPYVKKFYGVLPIRVDFLCEMYGIPREKCDLLLLGADDELVKSVNTPEIRIKTREKYKIDDNDFLIITAGKIDAWKKQTLLLMQAVREIENSNVKLIVFGSVADDLKKNVNDLSDGVKVQYIGWVNTEKSYELFSSADLVVFPGRHSVMWEQVAALGIPMIVKDWPGTHHVDVDGNVRFLKEDSIEEMKTMISNLLINKNDYLDMKTAAQKSKIHFSYNAISQKSIGASPK